MNQLLIYDELTYIIRYIIAGRLFSILSFSIANTERCYFMLRRFIDYNYKLINSPWGKKRYLCYLWTSLRKSNKQVKVSYYVHNNSTACDWLRRIAIDLSFYEFSRLKSFSNKYLTILLYYFINIYVYKTFMCYNKNISFNKMNYTKIKSKTK